MDACVLARVRSARAAARERTWALIVAARITRSARQTRVRVAENWPWATDLVTAFARLSHLRAAT
jgi:hypothetical protein